MQQERINLQNINKELREKFDALTLQYSVRTTESLRNEIIEYQDRLHEQTREWEEHFERNMKQFEGVLDSARQNVESSAHKFLERVVKEAIVDAVSEPKPKSLTFPSKVVVLSCVFVGALQLSILVSNSQFKDAN